MKIALGNASPARVTFCAVLVMLIPLEVAAPQSGEGRLRVHVLPLSTAEEEAVVAAVMTAADTTALTLRLLGEYEVTEVRETTVADAQGYLEQTEPGEFDRLLTLSIDPLSRGYEISTTVIDPLTEERLVAGSLEVSSALDLFAATDDLLQQVLGELSGRRIAFGEIAIERGTWSAGAIEEVAWERLDLFDESALYPSEDLQAILADAVGDENTGETGYRYSVDATDLDTEKGSSQRVLVGRRSIAVYQNRLGSEREIQRTVREVGENQRVMVTVNPPLLTGGEAATLNGLLTEVAAAAATAEESGDPGNQQVWLDAIGDLRGWCDSAAETVPAFATVADRIELIELAAQVEAVRYRAARNWQDPQERWLATLAELRGQAQRREGDRYQEVASYARESYDTLLQLNALAHIRHLREEEWQPVVNGYELLSDQVEAHGFQPPRWLVDDTDTIDAIMRRYEEESRNRPGLYRALTWGGVTVALAGGGAWGWGFSTALDNEDTYDAYQATQDPGEAESLREELETDRQFANILQAGGIGAFATGVAGVVTGTIIRRRDQRIPEREMIERLESHFAERLAYRRQLEEREDERLNLGLFRFAALE